MLMYLGHYPYIWWNYLPKRLPILHICFTLLSLALTQDASHRRYSACEIRCAVQEGQLLSSHSGLLQKIDYLHVKAPVVEVAMSLFSTTDRSLKVYQ